MYKNHSEKKASQLPSWLWINSASLPSLYKIVWNAVREDQQRGTQDEVLVDTEKIFALLLTSRLSTDVLGRIWGLANRKYAGRLTEQELYVVLALVAIAQSSCAFNSLDILHSLPYPAVPYLNLDQISRWRSNVSNDSTVEHHAYPTESIVDSSNLYNMPGAKRHIPEPRSNARINNYTTFSSDTNPPVRQQFDIGYTTAASSDAADEFTEFQSAPLPPPPPPPPTINTVPHIQIWEGKQGSAIGSRLANHNLGVTKTFDKSKKVASTNSKQAGHNNLQVAAKFPTSGSVGAHNREKEQILTECCSEIFSKCTVKNRSKTVILRDTAIRSYSGPKDRTLDMGECRTNIITENEESLNTENRISTEKAINFTVSSKKNSDAVQRDLMNLQLVEDKYSALRELMQETTPSETERTVEKANDGGISADDFGDFVSAEISNVVELPSSDLTTVERQADVLTTCDLESRGNATDSNFLTDLQVNFGLSDVFENLKLNDTPVEQSDVLRSDSIADPMEGKVLPKEDTISVNSIESSNGAPGVLTRSGSVPSLDLKSFLPSASEDDPPTDASHQVMYWEWKQYMESCVLLLQVAANIFSSITTEAVLREVLNSAQGYYFLCHLAEVAAVCRRVNFSYKEMDICIMGFDELLMDIDRIWAEMEPFYVNIPIVTELPAWPIHQGDSVFCSLCLTIITNRRVVHNDNNYHATCANLWLRCVSNHLPVMRYPVSHSQIVMCPTSSHI